MKYKICYIDDESYGIPQVINSIPKEIDYDFFYYNRISDIIDTRFHVIILDFYLDKDKKTALDIVDKFPYSIIISFSSASGKNRLMLESGADYSVEKQRNTNQNKELEEILEKICT